ncbi:Ankyrin-1 [Exaiptasia diaphana]|nr:Ankyrin-1 [Exaiptasia diaphana]
MASRRTFKREHETKQTVADAFRTIVEQVCAVQELDRGESFFGRVSVRQADEKENEVSNLRKPSWPRVTGVLAAKRQFLRKKSSVNELNDAITQGKDINEIKRFGIFDGINSSDEFGKTPLHCAAASQNVDVVMYLIERKANVNVLDDRGETPLHAAVRTGNVSLVNALVKSSSIDVNLCGSLTKTTPLHLVAQLEHPNSVRICKLLIMKDANLFLRDCNNKTAVSYAAQLGNHELMRCILRGGKLTRIKPFSYPDPSQSVYSQWKIEGSWRRYRKT